MAQQHFIKTPATGNHLPSYLDQFLIFILSHALDMSATKLITVYGATGSQGGSVINSLLQNKSHGFTLRAISRNPESDKAKALAARGVEVVKGDGFIKGQMVEAFKGSWGAFVNTNSADPVCDTELVLGVN